MYEITIKFKVEYLISIFRVLDKIKDQIEIGEYNCYDNQEGYLIGKHNDIYIKDKEGYNIGKFLIKEL